MCSAFLGRDGVAARMTPSQRAAKAFRHRDAHQRTSNPRRRTEEFFAFCCERRFALQTRPSFSASDRAGCPVADAVELEGKNMRFRVLALLIAVVGFMAIATPAQAIKGGVPDDGAHPYVGQLLFYDPTAIDPRFDDPGGWFNCSGTLVSPTVVVTAGHCTFGTGINGEPTRSGSGGNDVWISFAEEPDYSILPPSYGVHPRRQRGPLRGVVGGAERLRRVDPGHRLPAPRVRRRRVLRPRPGRPAAQRAGYPARVRAAAHAGPARARSTGRTSSSRYTAVGLRPGGLGAEDLVRWGHPAAGGAAAGQPQRGPGDRQGHCQRSSPATPTPAAPASVTPAGRSSSPARPPWWPWCRSAPAPPALAPAAPTASTRRTT